jgi:serine/threonine protein kinase
MVERSDLKTTGRVASAWQGVFLPPTVAAGRTPLSQKSTPSDAPESDRELPTEVGQLGYGFTGGMSSSSSGGSSSIGSTAIGPGTGPLGTGTLAFEPGFSLETQYSGEAPQFAEGSLFGVYVVGPCIGEGGMARVYRAEHAGLKRQVALKVMTQGFARDSEGRERFLREARIAAAIKHPNVVNIFDVGVCQGIPYLVMELLEGEDLEKVLLSRGALDESTIIDLVVPVVAGLVAVHDAGIVHRDLKPGNIFLARGRNDEIEPKLLDFGISKASGKDHLRLTAANGSLMGTPFYMAPEAVQGAEMTPLSDQYALGVVLRECATGKNPFEGNNFAEVVGLITNAKYAGLAESNPRLSKRFCAIIERSMNVDPRNRFEDMRAMGRQLLLLAGQRTRITWGLSFGQEGRGPLALATLERKSTDVPTQSVKPRKKRATALLLAGVAVLSASLTTLFLTTDRDGTSGAQAHAVNTRGEVTMVMPNAPRDEQSPSRGSESANAPVNAPASTNSGRPGEAEHRAEEDPSRDGSLANGQDEQEAASPAEPSRRKPQRVLATRTNDRAERPRSRPTPQRRSKPRPAAVEEPGAEWDDFLEISSKEATPSKVEFEVGSNNAPILD